MMSIRRMSTKPNISVQVMPAKPATIPTDTSPVQCWTIEATHSHAMGIGPQKLAPMSVMTTSRKAATDLSIRCRAVLPRVGSAR